MLVIRMRFVYQERNMCGIVGYLGKGSAQESLVDGLRRLEYRGYDSAGVAFHEGSEFSLSRETGRLRTWQMLFEERGLRLPSGSHIPDGLLMVR